MDRRGSINIPYTRNLTIRTMSQFYRGGQKRTAFTALGVLLFFSAPLTAETIATQPRGDDRGTLSVVVENDVLAGKDRNYTNGVRISWLSGTRRAEGLTKDFLSSLAGAEDGVRVRRGFALGQSIFTPNNTEAEQLLPNQHPYAAWLYGEYSMLLQQQDVLDQLTIQAGIVGPSARGEWPQNEFHSLIDTDPANGWCQLVHFCGCRRQSCRA